MSGRGVTEQQTVRSSTDAESADAESTGARMRMIATAERIVAERGLSAMSLRTVQQESGQRNKSAPQYHFGSRDGLIEAVVVTRMSAVNGRRRELLDQVDGEPTRALVEALVLPLAEQTVLRPTSHWARFVVQAGSDPSVADVVRRRVEGEPFRELVTRLSHDVAGVPDALRVSRVERAVGLVFLALAAMERDRDTVTALGSSPDPLGVEQTRALVEPAVLVEDLVDCTVALLATTPSPATLAALGRRAAH